MLQHAAKTLSLDKVLYCEGLSFGIIRNPRQVQLSFVQTVDALIVQAASDQEFEEVCRTIRTQPDTEDYLKPVFMVKNSALRRSWGKEVDGIAELDDLNGIAEIAQQIIKQVSRIATVHHPPQSHEINLTIKLLQFLFSRQKELLPYPNRFSKVHFQFPFVSILFSSNEEQKVLHLIKFAERQGWLSGKTLDKVHLCPSCSSSHQNLRATCPKCGSVDLSEEDLIHHFQCANISPFSDYQVEGEDGLHCPKCDKKLRHIGNDYDKPSSIYSCNGCHHTFQQSDFKSLCIDCGTENDLHSLSENDIKQLQLTNKGKSVVLNGAGFGKSIVTKEKKAIENGIFDFDVFKILVRQEAARRNNLGVIGQVKVEGMMVERIPAQTRDELALEVCQVIKSYLNAPDVVSARGTGSYYFMMTDIKVKDAEFLNEVLTFNLKQLIESNFKQEKVSVKVQLEAIHK